MKSAWFPLMPENRSNLLLAAILLATVMGCVFRSDRETMSRPESSELPVASASPVATPPTPESPAKKPDAGDFVVEQQDLSVARFQRLDNQVKTEKMLEKAADRLNQALILPHNIFIRTRSCGEQNAFYDAKDRSVTVCFEMMERFLGVFRAGGESEERAYEKMFDAMRFIFLHEVGHALIDAYKLPVAGNEEDAADRLAAYVNLTELGEDGVKAVYAASDAFNLEAKQTASAKRKFADEHLLNEQRFYTSLCMIYGSDASKHARIVDAGYLPKERAVRCRNEYQRTVESWRSLLEPWRKR